MTMATVRMKELKYNQKFSESGQNYSVAKQSMQDAVNDIQSWLTREHKDVFTKSILEKSSKAIIVDLIKKYVFDHALVIDEIDGFDNTVAKLVSEICEFGILDQYLNDDSVTEIQVNGVNEIFIERNGRLQLTDSRFVSEKQAHIIARKILRFINETINETEPFKDARLPDGSRINVVISPVALKGISMTIRKFSANVFTDKDYLDFGTCSEEELEFIKMLISGGNTVFFVGPTGSGKTTFMNYAASFIPDNQRIVSIEDTHELNLAKYDQRGKAINNYVPMETKAYFDEEGRTKPNMKNLLINALRMTPKWILVGEVRGGEAMTLLEAIRTGHMSLASFHAESTEEAPYRLLTMCKQSGTDLSEELLLAMITGAVDFIVYIEKLFDNSRKVLNITEIIGTDGMKILTKDIFIYEIEGRTEDNKIKGEHKQVGVISEHIYKKLLRKGIDKQTIEKFMSLPEEKNKNKKKSANKSGTKKKTTKADGNKKKLTKADETKEKLVNSDKNKKKSAQKKDKDKAIKSKPQKSAQNKKDSKVETDEK